MNITEVKLFRILTAIFGTDKVIYNMNLRTVVDSLPCKDEKLPLGTNPFEGVKCLFTIVDYDDLPCLVVSFEQDLNSDIVDLDLIENTKVLSSILPQMGVKFAKITEFELEESIVSIRRQENYKDFCELIEIKVNTVS